MVKITTVEQGSLADTRGLKVGDILLKINQHDIHDVLDYRFYLTEKNILLSFEREGEPYTLTLHKEEYEDLGLGFATPLMDKKRCCANNCIFCFIDQLPKGLRETLYFKDDDARLSFLHGNYITLTNLTQKDIDRMIAMRISPINISVHTTDPLLRVQMMKNKRAGDVLDYMHQLAVAGIAMRGQVVLCRGVNDGEALLKTVEDLALFYPYMDSLSVVPAGLTDYREGLYPLTPFTQKEAKAVIRTLEKFARKHAKKTGCRFVYPSDEWYLTAGKRLPCEAEYDGYPQIENGVGMLTSLIEEFSYALKETPKKPCNKVVSIATGVSAYKTIQKLAQKAQKKYRGLTVRVYAIENHFFGKKITVAGLVTGRDLAEQLTGRDLGEGLLIPRSMLRSEGDLFLCGMSLEELSETLGVSVETIEEDGGALLSAMLKEREK